MSTTLPRPFGNYLLLQVLGEGASGAIYLARKVSPTLADDLCVVKRLHSGLKDNEELLRRFRHEATVAVSVSHPNVVRIDDVGFADGEPYMAMEYIHGCPLTELLNACVNQDVQIPVAAIGAMIVRLLHGLHELHTAASPETGDPLGVVHRDISPSNVLVGEDGLLHLIDFGLGKSAAQDWKTRTGMLMGTLGYIAPEQVLGEEEVDHRADLYSVGTILYELLVLAPFIKPAADRLVMLRSMLYPEFVPPSQLRPGVSAKLDEVVRRALATDREERFGYALELAEAIESASASQPVIVQPGTLVQQLLGKRLNQKKERIETLLAEEFSSSPPAEHTHVVARRSEIPGEEILVIPVEDLPVPRASSAAARAPHVHSVAAPQPRGGFLELKVPLYLMLVAMPLTVLATLLFQRAFESAPMVIDAAAIEPPTESSLAPPDRPDFVEVRPTIAPRNVKPLSKKPIRLPTKEKRPPRTIAKSTPPVKEVPTAKKPPKPRTKETVPERAGRLKAMCIELRTRHPDQADQLNKLRADITMLRVSRDEEAASKRLDIIEARLREIAKL